MRCACARGWPSGVSALHQKLSVSSKCYKCFSATVQSAILTTTVTTTVQLTCKMHVSACQYFVQANTTLLDCIPTQYFYDLGVLPGSTYQCILGNVYVRYLPSNCVPGHVQVPWKTCSQRLEGPCHAVEWLAHFSLHPWHGCIPCAACI